MSVDAEQMQGGSPAAGPPDGAPPAGPPPSPIPPPGAAGMTTPQQPKGDQASAASKIQIVRKMLEQALVSFGSDSKEGKAVMKALTSLTAAFSKSEESAGEIVPAEHKNALLQRGPSGAPQAPSTPPKPAPAQGGGMPPPPG